MARRPYKVLLEHDDGSIEKLGTVRASTHHVAKNIAKRQYSMDSGLLWVVPEANVHRTPVGNY